MAPRLLSFLLLPLSLTGYYILFREVHSMQDGIDRIVASGHYENSASEPYRYQYTLTPLDQALSPVVAFFYESCSGDDRVSQLFTFYFLLGNLVPLYALWWLEASRKNAPRIVRYPAVWGIIFQLTGFCGTAPIYTFLHLWTTSATGTASRPIAASDASAVLTGTLLGGVLPTVAMLLPHGSIRPAARQLAIALWQPFPVWVSLGALVHKRVVGGASNANHLIRAYTGLFLLSATTHGYTLAQGFVVDPELLVRAFAPRAVGSSDSLAEAALCFLQWDLYIGFCAILLWTGMSLWPLLEKRTLRSAGSLAAVLVGGAVFVSPAATCAAAFAWREAKLQQRTRRGGKKAH